MLQPRLRALGSLTGTAGGCSGAAPQCVVGVTVREREVLPVESSSAGDERRMVADECSPSGSFFPSACWDAFCPWDQPRIYARPQLGVCAGTRTAGAEPSGAARARRDVARGTGTGALGASPAQPWTLEEVFSGESCAPGYCTNSFSHRPVLQEPRGCGWTPRLASIVPSER